MTIGRVKFFNEEKGYGFIMPENGTDDIFFHITNVPGESTLEKNTLVSFEVEQEEKGSVAKSIEVLDEDRDAEEEPQTIEEFLTEIREAHPEASEPGAYYVDQGDCLFAFWEDVVYHAEPINDVITLFKEIGTDKIIGVQIKQLSNVVLDKPLTKRMD